MKEKREELRRGKRGKEVEAGRKGRNDAKKMGTRDITFVVSMLRRNTCAIRKPPYVRTLNIRESVEIVKRKKLPESSFFFFPCDIVAGLFGG